MFGNSTFCKTITFPGRAKIDGEACFNNPIGGVADIDHLLNVISGRHALNKKAKANQDLDILEGTLRNSFSDGIFVELLKIPLEEIIVFLFYCAEKASLKQQLDKSNPIEMLEFLKIQALAFRRYRGME